MLRRDALISPSSNDISTGVMEGLCRFNTLDSRRAIAGFRAAAPLPPDSQMIIDDAVVRVGRQELVLVNDLISAGLTSPLPQWLGVMEIAHDRTNDVGYAMRSMEIDVRGERQVPQRDRVVLPVFATHDDFSFGPRELAMSERVGLPLNTEGVEQATRNVNVAVEDQAWNGWVDGNGDLVKVAGNPVPGVLTAPSNTYTGDGVPWTDPSKTGAAILSNVLGMLAIAEDQGFTGPKRFYMSSAYWSKLAMPFSDGTTTFDTPILGYLNNAFSGRNIQFGVAPQITGNIVAMIQFTNNVIDVIDGQRPAEVSWSHALGRRYFVILACQIVRIKTDYNGGAGIVIADFT
jgi:hypothetical protein